MATTVDSMLAEVKEDYKKNFGRDATSEDMEKRKQRLEKSFQKHPVSGMMVPEDVARAYTAKELNAMASSKNSGKLNLAPLPEGMPKLTEAVAKADAERAERKAAKASGGGGGGGIPKVGPKKPFEMKAGGKVSSASKRADGCAIKGKTRGRMV
jgi:galactokinase